MVVVLYPYLSSSSLFVPDVTHDILGMLQVHTQVLHTILQ